MLAPTREVAVQIKDVIQLIGAKMTPALRTDCFIGGISNAADKVRARSCHLVVGTPGTVSSSASQVDIRHAVCNCLLTHEILG